MRMLLQRAQHGKDWNILQFRLKCGNLTNWSLTECQAPIRAQWGSIIAKKLLPLISLSCSMSPGQQRQTTNQDNIRARVAVRPLNWSTVSPTAEIWTIRHLIQLIHQTNPYCVLISCSYCRVSRPTLSFGKGSSLMMIALLFSGLGGGVGTWATMLFGLSLTDGWQYQ